MEVFANHVDGFAAPRGGARQLFELKQQALGQVAGAHAGGIEALHEAHGRLDFGAAKADFGTQRANEFAARRG